MNKHMCDKRCKNRLFCIISIVILLIFFISFMCLTYREDEEVTMGFMEHEFHSLISIDSLDVHPPLYYILLKTFLLIFTFWTKSFFIKTIFARFFSLLCFIAVLYFLKHIAILSNVHLNKKVNFILFCSLCFMPSVLEVATYIRMYELATLFIVIEYYMLIKFNKVGKYNCLIFAIIFATLASYTHYFIAVVAGLLLIVFCIKEFELKYFKRFFGIIIASILFMILYIPMIPYVIRQFINRNKFPLFNDNIYDPTISSFVQLTAANSTIKESFDLILFLILLLLTFILIKLSHNKMLISRIHEIGLCVSLATIIEIIISIFYAPFYECRFIFPLVLMYFFFLLILFISIIKEYNFVIYKFINRLIMILSLICILFIGLSDVTKFNQSIRQYDIPSIKLINDLNKDKENTSKNINVTLKNYYPTQFQEALYATQSAVYLKVIGKNAVVYHPNSTNLYSECNSNRRFVCKLFTNLRVKGTPYNDK